MRADPSVRVAADGGRFVQLLFERRARTLARAVEQQQAFRQRGVVESVRAEQRVEYGSAGSERQQLLQILAALSERGRQGSVKGEARQRRERFVECQRLGVPALDRVGPAGGAQQFGAALCSQQLLEHARGRPRGGHEALAAPVAGGEVGECERHVTLCLGQALDAVTEGAWPHQRTSRRRVAQQRQLALCFPERNAALAQRVEFLGGERHRPAR